MRRVGLVVSVRPQAVATARWLAGELDRHGAEVYAFHDDAERAGASQLRAVESFPADLDLVLVLGGDGTLLRAASLVGRTGVPLLGVNFGHLGFLSELERAELESALRRVLQEGFEVEERMLLEARVEQTVGSTTLWALNDVIVQKLTAGRAVRLSVLIEGEPVVSWAADGLIVSTPTGSTAYAFSAGGPVVSPRVDCIVVTPVAPHGLFNRSMIVPAGDEVIVRIAPDPDGAAVSADGGAAVALSEGAEVRVRAAKERVRLAKLEPMPFWRLVREKLGLGREER